MENLLLSKTPGSISFLAGALLPFALLAALCVPCSAQTAAALVLDNARRAYYDDEDVLFVVRCANNSQEALRDATITLDVAGAIKASVPMAEIPAGKEQCASFRFHGLPLKPDAYEMQIAADVPSANGKAGVVASLAVPLTVARRTNPDHLIVWLWGGGGDHWYAEHGFTTWSGPSWTSNLTPSSPLLVNLDKGLAAGADVGISPNGGLRDVNPSTIPDPDAANIGLREKCEEKVANPFHPEVARLQEEANRKLMEAVRNFPQVKTAFFNTEIVDQLRTNRNAAGLRLIQEVLGFTQEDIGPAKMNAPGVLADDDRKYLFHKYVYKQGNGLTLTNKRAADMIHRYRPDILAISDPYRETCLLDLFPGLDVIGTWTYTNPDPKLMLYIETLRAACKPTGQIPLNTVTLLNYPGELAPTKEWMLMGPGRLTVTTWINLSRAPKILGYYYSSECNPVNADSEKVPYATSATLKNLAERVFRPFGPLLTNLNVTPRRIAVLSSAAARLYETSPNLLGGYGNMQIYHFYTAMAMAHLQADVIFDETIERFGLAAYDLLALPKCDVLTQSVYDKIIRFRERGGIVITDQYLGPDIPGAIRFDFDFTYRKKVTANALAKNTAYAEWDDHLDPGNAVLSKVEGVTAFDDQRLMESYAATLKSALDGLVKPDVDCDTPKVLLNMLEKDGAQYLVLINDHRTYDDREGKFKAVLGKILPQTTTVTLRHWRYPDLYAYDLMARKALDVKTSADSSVLQFEVALDELGGTIIALYPAGLSKMDILAPETMKPGISTTIAVILKNAVGNPPPGLQPIQLAITDPDGHANAFSGYYAARSGVLSVPFVPALNDMKGKWHIMAHDLTAGLEAEHTFVLAD